ncbi:hypothetical protein ASPZODRAFT_132776 [Penicilliopsis zonata CBS 506.65]|uniref:Metallo-beta-lactamase domain-containing protein n=1 Tax=Penicilliopsis zonata CBS 506.65 TaxID=1073090 RepID=A0A1L9SHK6_9EURO|nr:hypothetical protein ASPZODRAFT_132776 [Penicilliopsis zonata CBS 506.65]OJJ46668.1 hypothetical protein ASPZODRAFT_132776 [Penicilliopsis zonata CBS 506.65]
MSNDLHLPSSSKTVAVRVIDTTTELTLPIDNILWPRVQSHKELFFPSYAFLIEHGSSGRRLLFDLGLQKNWEDLAPTTVAEIKKDKWQVKVEKDVAGILDEHGYPREQIEAIIWSHHHWDHVGDPSTFPASTSLIVGPGFKERYLPRGKPIAGSSIKEQYYQGRSLREIERHEFTLDLAGFAAFDYFGDGSFYLLDTPGHTIGHISGLARTGPDNTFIFLGGDIAHHCGEFRPSALSPLPDSISPSPLEATSPRPCPGDWFARVHHACCTDQPFYRMGTYPDGSGVATDLARAEDSLATLQRYDAHPASVFVILAHDPAMRGVIDFFPLEANGWKEKGWAEKTRWAFLADFRESVVTHLNGAMKSF